MYMHHYSNLFYIVILLSNSEIYTIIIEYPILRIQPRVKCSLLTKELNFTSFKYKITQIFYYILTHTHIYNQK